MNARASLWQRAVHHFDDAGDRYHGQRSFWNGHARRASAGSRDLRRLRLAPITPGPILFSSLVSGVLMYLPSALLTIMLGNGFITCPCRRISGRSWSSSLQESSVPRHWFDYRGGGVFDGRGSNPRADSIYADDVPERYHVPDDEPPHLDSNDLRFLPATYLKSGMAGIIQNNESLVANSTSVAALLGTCVVGFIISFNIFRWSKEDHISSSAKVWVAAVIAPFLVLGAWESYGGTDTVCQAIAARQLARSNSFWIHDVRVFVGDGRVIDRADV